jgi:membrane protein
MNRRLRGGRGRALFDLLRTTWAEYERDYAGFLASAMIYYALVSLVPLILLLLSVLGLLLRFSDVAAAAEIRLLGVVANKFGNELPVTIGRLLDQLQQGSIIASGISLVGLLVTGSALFKKLRLSFRAIWKYEPPLVSGSVRTVVRMTLLEQVKSFLLVLVAGLLLVGSLALVAIIQWLTGLFSHVPMAADTTAWLLALPIPVIIVTLTFALLFKLLPPVRLQWRDVSLAAVLCAGAWFIAAEILALYVLYFGTTLGTYGAIGGLLIAMFWMNIVSQSLFYGAELCKVMASS